MQTADRLAAVLDHLGIARAHFATQVPGDLAPFAATYPERIGGLVLCTPTRLDPAPFAALAPRLLMIAGETGLSAEATRRAQTRLPAARRRMLPGYAATGWSDVVAERTEEVILFLTGFLATAPATEPATLPPLTASGSHAGLNYRISGAGPPLLLLPFFLAPSQWEPARGALGQHFTVIEIGGAHLGGVAALEDRARAPSYQAMFRTLIDLIAPAATDRILDVGAGSGALDRLLAARLGAAARIDAIDHNRFLLREAAQLALPMRQRIRFCAASATALPFAEETFAAVFSVTVLEECDAEAAIAEMLRVARPGARIGLVVRAIDMPQWWNLPLPPAIKAKAEIPPQSVGPGGVADASLYARMRRAGLVDLTAFPMLITLDDPQGPIWRYREDHVLSQLSASETASWAAARTAAADRGALLCAHVLHCAVATKP